MKHWLFLIALNPLSEHVRSNFSGLGESQFISLIYLFGFFSDQKDIGHANVFLLRKINL